MCNTIPSAQCLEVLCSYIDPETRSGILWFFSVTSGKCWDSESDYAINYTFQILSDPLFTGHSVRKHRIIQATENFIK
jgi:hypothetical protein